MTFLLMSEYKLHEYDKWVTDWSYFVGYEYLGKVRIYRKRFGSFISVHEGGKELVTGGTFESCRTGTFTYLYGHHHGWEQTSVTYDSIVGGKL